MKFLTKPEPKALAASALNFWPKFGQVQGLQALD